MRKASDHKCLKAALSFLIWGTSVPRTSLVPIPCPTCQLRTTTRASYPFQNPLHRANPLLPHHHCVQRPRYTNCKVITEPHLTKTDEVGHCGAAPASTRALARRDSTPTWQPATSNDFLHQLVAARLPSHSKPHTALINFRRNSSKISL